MTWLGRPIRKQSLYRTLEDEDPRCEGGPQHREGHVHDSYCVPPLPEWYVTGREDDDNPAVLAGRLEGVQQERDALRARVRQLLDQREVWVQLLQRVMAERDAARAERG
ncbi:MAG TPA: hypothetical protein VJ301_13535 [Propionibacteriaceae bacterium]|nr:hypothetical protein [Propionibacteriaceae bacterium]